MTEFSFIHAADLHLDSPLLGLTSRSPDFAARVEQASRNALDNLVELAIAERCRFVLFAGDVFDGELRNIRSGLFFVSRMRRLEEAGVQAFIILGNHDAENRFMAKLDFSANVRLFSTRRAETVRLDDVGAAIHGRSFPQRDVSENLAQTYPAPVPGAFNIGMLHTACANAGGAHAPYAPCSVEQLRNHGYDYWALGHIHDRQVLSESPPILFSGNLQGRSVRECGAKGATLVRVRDGAVAGLEHRALDAVRWADEAAAMDGAATFQDALAAIRDAIEAAAAATGGLPLALRLRLEGRTALHGELALRRPELRDEVETIAASISDDIWLEKLVLRTRPLAEVDAGALDPSIAGALKQHVASLSADEAFGARLNARLDEIRTKLPAGARADELIEALRATAAERSRDLALALISCGGDGDAL